MEQLLAVLGKKLVQAVKKKIANFLMSFLKNGKKEEKGKTFKWVIGISAVCIYMAAYAVEFIIGGVVHLSDTLLTSVFGVSEEKELSEEDIAVLMDAGALSDRLKDNDDFDLGVENSFLMDEKTFLKVLDAVADYNERMQLSQEVTYQYVIEKEPFVLLEDYTGRLYVEEIEEESEDKEKKAEGKAEDTKKETTTKDNTAADGASKEEGGGKGKVKINSSYEKDSVFLSTNGIDNAPGETGQNIFFLNWQPIMVLSSMYIQDNYQNIGTYEEDDEYGKSVYLSNSELQKIIGLLAYEYTYYQDYCQTGVSSLSHDYIYQGMYGYRLVIETGGEAPKRERVIKRVPAIAPKQIENSYLSYEYVYEPLPNGYYFLKERTCTVDGTRFVTACKELIPSFEPDVFLELLSCLPQTEGMVEHYRSYVFERAENGELYTNTVNDPSICPSIGVFVSNGTGNEGGVSGGGIGAMEWNGESHELPLYAINGWKGIYVSPGSWLIKEGNSYGTFEVYEDAMRSLTVSDGFSVEELEDLFENGGFSAKSPLFASKSARKDTAQCFYDYQEETGTSVCGLLAIMRQEGGFTSVIARNGWNFFNIKASGNQDTTSYTKTDGSVINTDFRNYKTEYEYARGKYGTAAVNALSAQMNWINRNYWSKGQNSYYLMVWNGYNVSDPERAYESISHSYCPPWDDQSMPYSPESYVIKNGSTVRYWKNANAGYRGWINNCAQHRYQYYTYVRPQ